MNSAVGIMDENSKQLVIPLKGNNARGFDTISMLLLAISYGCFLYKGIMQYHFVEIIGFALAGAASVVGYYGIKQGRWPINYVYLIFTVAGIGWFYQGGIGFAIGILLVLAGALRVGIKQTPTVTATADGVAIQNIFTRRYTWAELGNVIIKDGLLTVDCKNNRLFQKETADDIKEQDEAKFNEFCAGKFMVNSRWSMVKASGFN